MSKSLSKSSTQSSSCKLPESLSSDNDVHFLKFFGTHYKNGKFTFKQARYYHICMQEKTNELLDGTVEVVTSLPVLGLLFIPHMLVAATVHGVSKVLTPTLSGSHQEHWFVIMVNDTTGEEFQLHYGDCGVSSERSSRASEYYSRFRSSEGKNVTGEKMASFLKKYTQSSYDPISHNCQDFVIDLCKKLF